MDEPIYRAGAWWLRRADGRWIYWNVRRGSWDHHPYGPPVVPAGASTAQGRQGGAPRPVVPSGYEASRPPPPPPNRGTPDPPSPVTPPAAPLWQDPRPPTTEPAPAPYPPAAYVPTPFKPKPAPAWALGTKIVFAEWWQRMLAFIVDLLIVWGPTILVLTIVDAALVPGTIDPFSNEIDSSTRGAALIVAFALCYFVFFSAYFSLSNGGESGATVGKRLLRIRVADQYDGTAIGPGRAFLRWVLMGAFWVLAYIPGLLNFLWPLWDPKRQAWHDKLTNSVVVTAPR